jgi:pyridinium-3,5-bisthiocarboxylic acid mononucleotide nickel chelatase
VAGAGTGSGPWAVATRPRPSGRGEVEQAGAPSRSTSPLPLGRGRVATAHGPLPVPAPATAVLLQGLPVHDDGIPGERVTPTGAAILRHLAPAAAPAGTMRLAATGHGFGTRVLDGVPNLLRVLALADAGDATTADRVGVVRFEVDDQTPEDLATALDRLRALPPVRDACQWPVAGKKGRLAAAVQVLCDPAALDAVLDACLSETATIGLRWRVESRRTLRREDLPGAKRVRRPDGAATVKADADPLAAAGGYAARADLRRRIEQG